MLASLRSLRFCGHVSTLAVTKESVTAVNEHFIKSVSTIIRKNLFRSYSSLCYALVQTSFQIKNIAIAETRRALLKLGGRC